MSKPKPRPSCCICHKTIASETDECFLTVDGSNSYHHHLMCGHIAGAGTELVPILQQIVGMLKITGAKP